MMDTIHDNNIHEWVERFLNAETTIAEERAIYAYFARPDIPAEAEKYREMFGWYASLASLRPAAPEKKTKRPLLARVLRMRAMLIAGAAALVTIILSIGYAVTRPHADSGSSLTVSYIIRNGEKITDPEIVLPEIERAEQEVQQRLAMLDRELDRFDERLYRQATSGFNMDNPEIRCLVETALNY